MAEKQAARLLDWVIRDRTNRSWLPFDVRSAPKAVKLLRGTELSRWAMNGLMRRSKRHLYSTACRRVQAVRDERLGSLEVDDKLELRRRLRPSGFALRKPPTTGYPDKKGSTSELHQ